MIQRSWNSQAAATDHPWLSSDTAIWSLGVQAVCTIGQFSGIRTPLLFCRATTVKSNFDRQNPAFSETTAFSMIAGRCYAVPTIRSSFIQANNAFRIGYHIIILRVLFNPKIKDLLWQHLVWPKYDEFDQVLPCKTKDNEVAGWTWSR